MWIIFVSLFPNLLPSILSFHLTNSHKPLLCLKVAVSTERLFKM